jgi:RNA polymerase sigma-70 factor (sigma-E family)
LLRGCGRNAVQITGSGQASWEFGVAAQQIGVLAACKAQNPWHGGVMTFEQFAAQRLPGLLRFAAVLAGDRAQAEDLAQEVLIRVHDRWRSIGAMDRPEYYVRKMLVNEFLSWRRRSWRMVPAGRGIEVDTRQVPDHAIGYAERDALVAELGKLPPRQRAVLALRYYEGLSDPEIADALGCSPGTVRGYASRALAVLRVELTGQQDRAPEYLKETR